MLRVIDCPRSTNLHKSVRCVKIRVTRYTDLSPGCHAWCYKLHLTISTGDTGENERGGWNSVLRAMSRDRSLFRRRVGRQDEKGELVCWENSRRRDTTSNYRPSAGVVCCRVYRFNRVGREKHPRYVGTITKGRKEWEPLGSSGFRVIFFARST